MEFNPSKYQVVHIIRSRRPINTIRIYQECEDGLEKSVPRITVLASRGLPSDDKR